jgi:4-hydroxy-tetrahydrodipicolinate reductase
MTNVVITGAAGRMGQALVRCSRRVEGVRIAGAVEQAGHPAIGKDAGVTAGVDACGVAITSDIEAALVKGDVLIDFSAHAAIQRNIAATVTARRAAVIGTTGLSDAERDVVLKAAHSIPIVWAPNMSLGVNLLFALVQKAAGILGNDYDIEVVEMHHRHKKDAPSGTALKLAEKAAMGRGQKLDSAACYGREGLVGARPSGQIGLHAVRGGDIIGDHDVIFAADGERVTLSHRATSRDSFAMGALHAARWVVSQRPRLYDMQDVLGVQSM